VTLTSGFFSTSLTSSLKTDGSIPEISLFASDFEYGNVTANSKSLSIIFTCGGGVTFTTTFSGSLDKIESSAR